MAGSRGRAVEVGNGRAVGVVRSIGVQPRAMGYLQLPAGAAAPATEPILGFRRCTPEGREEFKKAIAKAEQILLTCEQSARVAQNLRNLFLERSLGNASWK